MVAIDLYYILQQTFVLFKTVLNILRLSLISQKILKILREQYTTGW